MPNNHVMNKAGKPKIVRIVVDGWTWCSGQENNIADARRMLIKALKHRDWPSRVDFAVTPGGFVRIPFRFGDIKGGWGSERYFERLLAPADDTINRLLTDKVKELLRDKARYLTVGADLNNTDEKASSETHAELVALVDAKSGKVIQWTGKSYPTTDQGNDQSRTLVQAPAKSHCFHKGRHRVLILGCHDLHMFGGRGRPSKNGQTPKEARREEMLKLAAELGPQIVLHHPHTTYSPNIWGPAWGYLLKTRLLPTVDIYASGISFCKKPYCPSKALDDQRWNCRQTLECTLEATKWGPVVDVVVPGFPCPVEEKWREWAASHC